MESIVTVILSVFNLEKKHFKDYDCEKMFPLRKLQESYEKYIKTVTFGSLTGIRMIYRKCPVAWGSMRYLAMPCPIEVGIGRNGITEHGFIGMAGENRTDHNYSKNGSIYREMLPKAENWSHDSPI